MILPVYLYGHPILRKVSQPLPNDFPDLQALVADMFETMYHARGVGLAAPQIGRSLRLIVLDGEALGSDYKECKNFKRVLVNPSIIEHSREEVWSEEGCLSLPGLREKVSRYRCIRVKYQDEQRQEHDELLHDFAARIVQHEYEHLDGHIFIDHLAAMRRAFNRQRLANIINGSMRCHYLTQAAERKDPV